VSPVDDRRAKRPGPRSASAFLVAAGLVLVTAGSTAAQAIEPLVDPAPPVPIVTVTAVTPLPVGGVDTDKIAGEVQALSVPDLVRDRALTVLPDVVASRMANVSLNNEQGNQFQPDLVYRGFEASPISGIAQGIAVYQDGVRLNESFGDSVNWDLVPEFAVRGFTVQSNNPVFGLNALGGAVTLTMKDGLNFQGMDAQLSGGSFGNLSGNAEYGARFGDFALYLGIGGLNDDGFRYQSQTSLGQAYADLAYQNGGLTLHLTGSGALSNVGAVGPTPVQLLARDPKAVFTLPQSIRNEMELVQLRADDRASSMLSFSANAYYRHFQQRLVDGNTTDVDFCDNDPSQLCLEGDNNFPDDALFGTNGAPVSASVLPPGATPGETDFTRTNTNSAGAAVQASLTAPLGSLANSFIIGASVDYGNTNYAARGELGTLEDNLRVAGSGVIIDQGLSPTAQPPIEEPVGVVATNTYTGVYAIDVLDLTKRLSWTVSGRLNLANIGLSDQLGDTLDSNHQYTHFNPGTGLTFKILDGLTLYGGVSVSNRAPTAAELSCSDPASPCLLDAFLVADPPLKQVVSHNYEFGLRGRVAPGLLPGTLTWSVGAYRTDADDDILLLATQINGFGFFQNAGSTRRQGVDLHLGYDDRRWSLNLSYAYLDATFLNPQVLASNSPAANADGLIFVHSGDHLPLMPSNTVTLSVDFAATRDWSVGADLRAQDGQYLVGDQSNQEPKLPGYVTIDLRSSYQIGSHLEVFGQVQNLFDQTYYTYGTFTKLDGLPPNFNLTNPRTYSPAPGRTIYGGVRLQFN
jgi:outer membrane receptor protein involved in Fe transport